MDDDLRNMVWKGHYLGTQPSDVMMHVPTYLQGKNEGEDLRPYHLETIAVARVQRIGRSAARRHALEVFTREKIGVGRTLADAFLLGVQLAACAKTWSISAAWPPPSRS
jgi:hypothetical protein